MTDRVADILLRWEEELERGNDLSLEEMCADCPELREEVEQKVSALRQMRWMTTETQAPPLPEVIADRYQVERLIGEGGHGQVVLAFDQELERRVAIKIPHEPSASLRDEARRVAKLRHDNIVAVHDVIEADEQCFFVAGYIDGESLADRIERGSLDPTEAATLIAAVADALHHAHEHGFVHRDIKPANILIDNAGKPYLTDFGIALSGEGVPDNLGTVAYMAPEQVAHEKQLIGSKSDIYSLGVVLHECLTGRLPYPADTPVIARESVLFRTPVQLSNGHIPSWLSDICLRCLAKHPDDRFESAKPLADALRTPARKPFRIPPWLKTTGVFLLGIVSTMLFWTLFNADSIQTDTSDNKPTIVVQDNALVFDGSYRIVTPVERFAPCTLEAWIKIDDYINDRPQFIIGSDIAPRFGNGLGIIGAVLVAEYIPSDSENGIIYSDAVVPLNEWTHVAAVFGESETRLFLNGKLVTTGPPTKPLGGTPFVIGCVGNTHPIDPFIGQIRSARISDGAIYDSDFEPSELSDSAEVVALYANATDGTRLLDLSNNGRHAHLTE